VHEHPTWEPWQRGYRYGAFLVVPPPSVAHEVDRLREEHDPRSAAICTAHITTSWPVPRPLTDVDFDELTSALSELDPFEASYGPLRVFRPHAGVAFEVGPVSRFEALRAAVHSTSVFSSVSASTPQAPPHMTVAEFITMERSDELLAELSATVHTGSFLCNELVFAAPDPSFHFERVRAVPLGRGPTH
jgi:hypothetical protein